MVDSIPSRRAALAARHRRWEPLTHSERLDACAQAWGQRPFVITDDRTISYAETADWSRRLADGLAALGVGPGEHVGMILANYLEFAPVRFAISRLGAVAVPFNYLYRRDELAYVLAQSQVSVVVTMTGFLDLDYLALLDDIAPGWPDGPTEQLPHLRKVVLLSTDGRRRDGVDDLDDLAALGEQNPGACRAHPAPGDVADILYTSGTTGFPKGVMVTHDATERTAYASAYTRAYEDGRRILFALPCYHMFGLIEGLASVMFVGGAIIPKTTFDPLGYLRGIERHSATDILCVPTMAVAIAEHPQRLNFDTSSLTAILCGSAPAPVWIWESIRQDFGVDEIVTGYGMTECGGAMTLTLPEDPLELSSTTVGRPKLAGSAGLGNGDLVVYTTVDPLTGEALPVGAEGELASSGPTTMVGYWNEPDGTSAVLQEHCLRSGDLGFVDESGYLHLTGRSKELYKSGGELVMPKEIEELLSRFDDISQVYAIGLVDDRWGEIGCAVVVRAPGATVTQDEVLARCRAKLARFKVPKQVLFLEQHALPTTPTGKIQKFRLVQQAQSMLQRSDG